MKEGLSQEIPLQAPTMPDSEAFLYDPGTSPHIHRYLALHRMSREEDRPQQRRELLKKTALDMLANKTAIGGEFMKPEEHVVFMADLATHGTLVQKERTLQNHISREGDY